MTNPTTTFNLPPSTAPIVDPVTGAPTPSFNFLLLTIQTRTGGVTGLNLDTVSNTANAALALSTTNAEQIASLHTQITGLQAAITVLQNTANEALATANNAVLIANSIRKTSLQVANNLSDLSNTATARINIGASQIGQCFEYPTLFAGQIMPFPIVRTTTIPASFAGTQTFAATVPLLDAIFTVRVNRSGTIFTIGTITLINSGNFNAFSEQPQFVMVPGDVLELVAPNPADSNLAGVGITLALTV